MPIQSHICEAKYRHSRQEEDSQYYIRGRSDKGP